MRLNWNFQWGGVVQTKTSPIGEVWIFLGTTHCQKDFKKANKQISVATCLTQHCNINYTTACSSGKIETNTYYLIRVCSLISLELLLFHVLAVACFLHS